MVQRDESQQQSVDVQAAVNARVARHPLTGEWLHEPLADLPRVFGVMIDNHVDARPPSGVDQAFLVIEAPVEASIPRMLAFFDETQKIEEIGPVRSARPYFIDWNNEFDALYAHVGGSDAALEKIVSGSTFDLNEFSNASSFWRDRTRYAPHNTYTSTELLNAYTQRRVDAGVAPEALYETWVFKDPVSNPEATSSVVIDFWAPIYTIEWHFDAANSSYERRQGGVVDRTRQGKTITAENVVTMVTDIDVLDSIGRRRVRTIGEGKAWVMQDGQVIEATWKKPSISQRLKFFVGEKEVEMNPGITWIEVVPSIHDVTFEPSPRDPNLVDLE